MLLRFFTNWESILRVQLSRVNERGLFGIQICNSTEWIHPLLLPKPANAVYSSKRQIKNEVVGCYWLSLKTFIKYCKNSLTLWKCFTTMGRQTDWVWSTIFVGEERVNRMAISFVVSGCDLRNRKENSLTIQPHRWRWWTRQSVLEFTHYSKKLSTHLV